MKVYKYPINLSHGTTIELPMGSKILTAGEDPNGQICVWALVDELSMARTMVNVVIVGTGHTIPWSHTNYIGTFKQGPFVWHAFSTPVTQ